MEISRVCIVKVRDKKLFGRWVKYDNNKKAYLVEFKKNGIRQWIPEQHTTTRNELKKLKGD